MFLSGVAPASPEAAIVVSLRCTALVEPLDAATKGGAFDCPGAPPFSAKTAPIAAAPATTGSTQTLGGQLPERRSIAKSTLIGSGRYASPNLEACDA